jgi:uncharacterized membrane protein
MTGHTHVPPSREEDAALEIVLGRLLRTGVLAAALIVASGGVFLLLARHGWTPDFGAFHGTRFPLRTVAGIVMEALALRPDGIVQTGLLVLIATPVLRVVFSLAGFVRERDWLYVTLTLSVLAVLAVGLAGWRP